jgi:hypothetical protein
MVLRGRPRGRAGHRRNTIPKKPIQYLDRLFCVPGRLFPHTAASDALARIVGGSVATAAGLSCLAYGACAWAAFFLVIAALNLAGGCWFLSIDRIRSNLS